MDNTDNKILINGVRTEYIDINDRSIHYGDGLFETILCDSRKLYHWQQHYQRLQKSARRLAIRCPAENSLLDDIRQLLTNENIAPNDSSTDESGVIKIILSRGAGERGYRYSKKISGNRIVMLSNLNSAYSSVLSRELLSGDLFLCKTRVSINESLAGIKHLNRLENVLAANEWKAGPGNPYIDGVMLDAEHRVIECTTSNIFAVKNGQLFTPDLTRSGVRGIMRDEVLRIAAEKNIGISECDITIDELLTMDELFITNSLIGLKSINRLGDTHYEEAHITQIIFDALVNTKQNHVQNI